MAAAAPITGATFATRWRSYYGASVAWRVVSYSKVQNLSDAKIFLAPSAALSAFPCGRVLSFSGSSASFAALDTAT